MSKLTPNQLLSNFIAIESLNRLVLLGTKGYVPKKDLSNRFDNQI
jgi:hypothetical protein